MVSLAKRLEERLSAITEDSRFEANVLLETVFGRDYRLSAIKGGFEPKKEQLERLWQLAERRMSGEPLQYIVGEWEFYGIDLKAAPGVLIPRQDTETLVELSLELIKNIPEPKIADLCAGSGCICAAIFSKRPDAKIFAVELYPKAYEILCENISRFGGITPVCADVTDKKIAERFSGLDLLVTNPPYLSAEDMKNLQPEVQKEPETALFGGEDGLDFYRAIPNLWRGSLKDGGHIAFEIGAAQKNDVCRLLGASGYKDISFKTDAAGKDRAVYAKK